MVLDSNLLLRKVGSRNVIVRTVCGSADLTEVFTLNDTASDIWRTFTGREFSEQDIIEWLLDNYDVTEDQALSDIREMLREWKEYGLIAKC